MILEDNEAKEFLVTTELREDGWYYSNIGYRWHGIIINELWDEIWDLERYEDKKTL